MKEINIADKNTELTSILNTHFKGKLNLARLRRKLSADQVAERAGASRRTLYSVDKGKSSVNIGNYIKVLNVLGLQKDFLNLAKDYILGRKLLDIGLTTKERAPKRN